jgi:hypothetical protein
MADRRRLGGLGSSAAVSESESAATREVRRLRLGGRLTRLGSSAAMSDSESAATRDRDLGVAAGPRRDPSPETHHREAAGESEMRWPSPGTATCSVSRVTLTSSRVHSLSMSDGGRPGRPGDSLASPGY